MNIIKVFLGLIVLSFFGLVGYAYLQNQKPSVRTDTPLSSDFAATAPKKEEKPELSDENKEAAKAALNAVGELESVASVGANYMQFTEKLQTAKIKFDAAMRDFEVASEDDKKISQQLAEVFLCYVDAKEAWGEFIEDGDEYGFLKPKSYSKIQKMASIYNLKMEKGEYYRATVLRIILEKASEKFNAVRKLTK
jgi:hypothetical protein